MRMKERDRREKERKRKKKRFSIVSTPNSPSINQTKNDRDIKEAEEEGKKWG